MWKQRRTSAMALSSIALAFAPKCPICFLAYFGIFGVATASASVYRTWLPALTAIWLVLTVAMLAFGRDAGRRAGPVALASAASIAIFAGKFTIFDQRVVFAGLAGLVTATIWRSWSRQRDPDCNQCQDRPDASQTQLNAELKP